MSDHSLNRAEKPAGKTWKRPYRKSTNGCKACKQRKIKCDELRPACGNCKRRFVDSSCCEYASPPKSKRVATNDSDSSSNPSVDRLVTSNPIGINSGSILELRLMHHYTRSTCGRQPLLNIASPTTISSLWEVEIPQLAFSNDTVLNAMLGIASFNLLSLHPEDRSLGLASRMYFNRAIVMQRDALNDVNRQNAEPLLVSAILLAHLTWLYAYSEEARPQGVSLSTYKMCKGAAILAEKALPWTPQYDFMTRLAFKIKIEEGLEYDVEFMARVHEDMDTLFQALNDRGITEEEKYVYEGAAADIVNTCHLIAGGVAESSSLEQHIVTNLRRVPPGFVELLEENDPIAMAILARNIALLGMFKDTSAWYIHGAGRNTVPDKAVGAILAQMPPEYKWTMDFPLNVLSKDIKVV